MYLLLTSILTAFEHKPPPRSILTTTKRLLSLLFSPLSMRLVKVWFVIHCKCAGTSVSMTYYSIFTILLSKSMPTCLYVWCVFDLLQWCVCVYIYKTNAQVLMKSHEKMVWQDYTHLWLSCNMDASSCIWAYCFRRLRSPSISWLNASFCRWRSSVNSVAHFKDA